MCSHFGKNEIIIYRHYSYFDQSWEAKYMRRERYKYKESFYTDYEKRLIKRNRNILSEIFGKFMPELLNNAIKVAGIVGTTEHTKGWGE